MDFLASFLALFVKNLLPMYLMIGTGVVLQKKLLLDIRTLNKINLYAFVPALMLSKIVVADIDLTAMGMVMIIYSLAMILMILISLGVASLFPATRSRRSTIALCSSIPNTGNYGVPLMALAFGPAGVVIQTVILTTNNLLTYTLGVYLAAHQTSLLQTVRQVLRIPVLYVLAFAVLIRTTGASLPGPVMTYIGYMGDGLVPIALVTLGAQLASTRLSRGKWAMILATTLKLIIAPILMTITVWVFSQVGLIVWGSIISKVLILASSVPSAVNTVVITMEFDSGSEIAAPTVFAGTLASAFTVSAMLYLLGV